MYLKIEEFDGYIVFLIVVWKFLMFVMCGVFKLNLYFIEILFYNWRVMGFMFFNFFSKNRWIFLYNIFIILFVLGCVCDGYFFLYSVVYFIFLGDYFGGGRVGDLLLYCVKFWMFFWCKGIYMYFIWL